MMAATEQELGELQAENELLILQLHQVQEELERYYLAYRELQNSGTSVYEHASSAVNVYSTRKPAFPPALLERINQSEISIAQNNKTANTELLKKHQAYLEQLQHNQELRSKLQEQGDELQALEVKLQEQSTLSVQFAKEKNILESQLNELKEEKEGKLKVLIEHDQALSQNNQELRSRLQEQGDQLQALEVKLQERSTLSVQFAKEKNILESQLNELNELKEEKEGKLKALIEHDQALSQNNQELSKSNSKLQEKIAEVSTLHQQSEQRAEALKIELTERAREIRLGQKMLAKAQVDLDHLREQYSQKSQSEQELIDLVKELRTKLEVASKYYFQIQQQYPELLNAKNQQKSQ